MAVSNRSTPGLKSLSYTFILCSTLRDGTALLSRARRVARYRQRRDRRALPSRRRRPSRAWAARPCRLPAASVSRRCRHAVASMSPSCRVGVALRSPFRRVAGASRAKPRDALHFLHFTQPATSASVKTVRRSNPESGATIRTDRRRVQGASLSTTARAAHPIPAPALRLPASRPASARRAPRS